MTAPTTEVTKVAASAAGATTATGAPRPTRIGPRREPGHADGQGRRRRGAGRGRAGRAGRCRAQRAQQQPQAEGQQQGGDEEPEDVRAGDGEHADHRAEDDAGHGPGDEQAGERPPQAPRPVVAQQGAGAGHDVVEEVGRGHRRARHPQDTDLHR
ncbi:hypothetical protein VR43_07735 [Streptomyces sp. NRRL S-104]|nr:hypothetical protein VR43_07735 [Streptomyces sp. NRRL S-104]